MELNLQHQMLLLNFYLKFVQGCHHVMVEENVIQKENVYVKVNGVVNNVNIAQKDVLIMDIVIKMENVYVIVDGKVKVVVSFYYLQKIFNSFVERLESQWTIVTILFCLLSLVFILLLISMCIYFNYKSMTYKRLVEEKRENDISTTL